MLPSVLFTAAVFDMPKLVETQLYNIQRNFLWQRSRHKINPDLLYTPKLAGGVKLASIVLACKTQKMKHAILWLTQRKDHYLAAWKAWAFRGATVNWKDGISPQPEWKRQPEQSKCTPGNVLQQMIGSWIGPKQEHSEDENLRKKNQMKMLAQTAISWATAEEWVLELGRPINLTSPEMTAEEAAFWPSYQWIE
ncbi:hypothetical protein V7S43_004315 [Phytophthora oleae]|uniref:Uncharacterized protein n=1 Tax=Phytophthora oleae TaxID=2107226 RepID=A0ABD3FW30_9STRA